MKRKRISTVWMLFVAAVLIVLVGCSSSNNSQGNVSDPGLNDQSENLAEEGEEGLPLSSEPVSFVWLMGERADAPVNEEWPIFQEIFKRTNVKINFEPTPSEGFEEKKQILIATDSIPDIASVGNMDIIQFGPDGVFLELGDLIEQHAPNIQRFLEEYPDAVTLTTAPDGGMYGLPVLNAEDNFSFSWMARKDLMDEYGIEYPETMDEFYDMLKTLKQHHPDSYPLTTRSAVMSERQSLFKEIIKMFTEVDSIIGFNPISQQFEFSGSHPEFVDALKFMNRLYEEELLDPEFAFLNVGQWEERLLNGRSFVTFDYKPRAGQVTAKGVTLDENFNLHPIPQVAADGKTRYQMTSPVVNENATIALSPRIDDPVLAIRFFDYMYSDEGTNFTELGILGETYEIVDGEPRLLESLGADFVEVLRRDYGVVYDGIRTGPQTKFRDAALHLRNDLDRITEELYADTLQSPPKVLNKSQEEIELERDKLVNLEKYLDERLTEFVMGRVEINEQTIQEFLEQCEMLGALELVDMYNRLHNE